MSEPFKIGLALAYKDGLSGAVEGAKLNLQALHKVTVDAGVTLLLLSATSLAPDYSRSETNGARRQEGERDDGGKSGTRATSSAQQAEPSNPRRAAQSLFNDVPDFQRSKASLWQAAFRAGQTAKPVKPTQVVVETYTPVSDVILESPVATSVRLNAQPDPTSPSQQIGRYTPRDVVRSRSVANFGEVDLPAVQVSGGGVVSPVHQIPRPNLSSQLPEDDSGGGLGTFSPIVVDSVPTFTTSKGHDRGQTNPPSETLSSNITWSASPLMSPLESRRTLRVHGSEPSTVVEAATIAMQGKVPKQAAPDTPTAPRFLQGTAENAERQPAAGKQGKSPLASYPSVATHCGQRRGGTNGGSTGETTRAQIAPNQDMSPMGVPRQDNQLVTGDIFLDGAVVGRWISRLLTKEADRASTGPTGYDTRRGRFVTGPNVGM